MKKNVILPREYRILGSREIGCQCIGRRQALLKTTSTLLICGNSEKAQALPRVNIDAEWDFPNQRSKRLKEAAFLRLSICGESKMVQLSLLVALQLPLRGT